MLNTEENLTECHCSETSEKNLTETERVILERRSNRFYKKQQVPASMIKRILEAGRFAPSAGNSQPWKFVVLRDPEIIEELTRDTFNTAKLLSKVLDYRRKGFGWLRPLTKLIIRLKPNDLHPNPFSIISILGKEKISLYFDAPTVILIFKDVRGVGDPSLDCGISGQNMILSAHSMGLGTCWVSFTKLAFKYTLSKKWQKRLGIEFPYEFASSIAVGWPKAKADGFVARQTHAVDWYENGEKKTLY